MSSALANIADRSLDDRTTSRDMRRLIDRYSGFAALGLSVRIIEAPDNVDDVAFTDGTSMTFAAKALALPERQRHFVMMHEISHCALAHPLRGKRLKAADPTYRHDIWNIACDGIINHMLAALPHLDAPDDCVTKTQIEKLIGTSIDGWSSEQVYWRLKVTAGDEPVFESNFADVRLPRKTSSSTDMASDADDDAEEQRAIARWNYRLSAGIGHIPKAADRLRGEMPKIGSVRWQSSLRTFLGNALGGFGRRPDPTRPHRRWCALEPGMRQKGIVLPVIQSSRPLPRPRIAVGIDTSGSVDDVLLGYFTREVASMLEHANAEVLLLVADADVHQTLELRGHEGIQRIRSLTYQGGGGTNFAPAIAAASAWNPRAMVYFTDLAGSAGPAPAFPVLWTVPESFGKVSPPFGTLLRIDG